MNHTSNNKVNNEGATAPSQMPRPSTLANIDMLWNRVTDNYELIKVLGKGSFGEVMKARHRQTNTVVAIKLLRNLFKDEYASKKIFSEVNILRRLGGMKGNAFTTKIYDLILPRLDQGEKFNYLFIVMDHAASDLKKVLSSSSQISFDEHHMTCILYNTLCSLNYLHTANMMHRDIKPANILIEPDCQIRLCDFGLSRPVPDTLILPNQPVEQEARPVPMGGHNRYNTQTFSETQSPDRGGMQTKIERMRLKRRVIYQTPSRISSKVSVSPMKVDDESAGISRNLFEKKPVLQKRPSSIGPMDVSTRRAHKDFLTAQLVKQRKHRKVQKRSLSNHITSRWYRPPEIILVEKNYNQSIDIWGLGCILAEMLFCVNANRAAQAGERNPMYGRKPEDGRFLFQGNSCFPLSPCEQMQKSDAHVNIVSERDQLKCILDKLGRQDEQDLSFITEQQVLEYHMSLDKADPSTKCADGKVKGLRDLYPHVGNDGFFELLEGMLCYNPHFRWSAAECLKHKVFDKLRVPQHEQPAPRTVHMPVYAEGSYDYDECVSISYDIGDFRKMIIEEVDLVRGQSPFFPKASPQKPQRLLSPVHGASPTIGHQRNVSIYNLNQPQFKSAKMTPQSHYSKKRSMFASTQNVQRTTMDQGSDISLPQIQKAL